MKRILLLLLLCSTTLLMAQQTDPIQEAMASYDYETALSLIAQKKPATPLLLQKGKALRSLGLNAEALSTYQEIIGKHQHIMKKCSTSLRRINMYAYSISTCFSPNKSSAKHWVKAA